MEPFKAYIYADTGDFLGYIAYLAEPPEVLEINGRFFQQTERNASDEYVSFDYREVDIAQYNLDVVYICIGCGRNSSMTWWKCCPSHMTEQGPDVLCQSCVERLHPGDPEFLQERG